MKLVVGLTGGIGSGKSAAAAQFARLGATVVDTDEIAHELTGPSGAAIPDIQRTFGKEAIGATTAKVASAAHSAVDIAAENLAHAEKALRDARLAAGEKAIDTARLAKAYSEDSLESVKTYIHLYPLRSVGIALAAGYLLSALLKHHRA